MAGSKVNDYAIGDANLTALMDSVDKQRIGYSAVSLNEYTTNDEPSITAGSKIEVNGALFEFESDESITGNPADGDVYIKLIPSGDSITAEYETDAPAWDDEKQGWYESGTNNRYLNYLIVLSGSGTVWEKYILTRESTTTKIGHDLTVENDLSVEGDLDVDGTIGNNGTPVYGYMTDGTPLFAKEITITFAAGDTTKSGAHSISNAYSSDRIKYIRTRRVHAATSTVYSADGIGAGDSVRVNTIDWDNTNVTITRTNTSGTAYAFICFIVYE